MLKPLTLSAVRNDHRISTKQVFLLFTNARGAGTLLTSKCPALETHRTTNALGFPGDALCRNWLAHYVNTILGKYKRPNNDYHTGCRNVSLNQQWSFSELHQPGRSTSHKHWLTWVTTNNSPQDYMHAPTRMINQPQTLTHLGHNQQSFSRLQQPGWSTNHKHWLTWVTTNNSPYQDYNNPDDQPTTNIDPPGS